MGEVQLDDNGNGGSSQDVEETEEDAEGKEKGINEEFNVEDRQKKKTVEDYQLIRLFTDTDTSDRSKHLEDLQMFDVENDGMRSQNGNGDRNFENCCDSSVKRKDEATFLIDGQYLSDGVNTLGDKAEQVCTIDNSDVTGHLCSDEDRCCRKVDKSIASVQCCENIRINNTELVSKSTYETHNRTLKNSVRECFSGNRLTVVNRGDGGVDGVLRQGHQERLHLKWHLQQQVNPQDWISLCSLSEYHCSM